jgi:RNA polymerase sigma factor (sigma-70 family)
MAQNSQPKRSGRSQLTAEQQDLAATYMPMARALARPLKEAYPALRDELESAACLALVEAAESYDPARNVRFSTFARHRIWGALRDVQRNLVLRGWRCDPGHAPSVHELTLKCELNGHIVPKDEEPEVGTELEQNDAFESWLRKLPARHAEACHQLYRLGKSQLEAARALGCSQSRLSHMHRQAIAMLNGRWDLATKRRRPVTKPA